MKPRHLLLLALLGGSLAPGASLAAVTPLPEKIPSAVADRQVFQVPDCVHLSGWVGGRVAGNESNRLVKIDTDRLLEGYRRRPGRQAWDCEHVGKWLHAATLAWVNTGDPALRAKLDTTVAALMKCQLDDGYLGTYVEKDRWTEWDVWAHKYNLIGLITYIRYTGNTAPLETCRRMADLLCHDLGDGPGQRDILTAGSQHVGMASTSVLEPMVLLYRLTGEQRYLDFCHYITRAWEQPNGPHIISRLLAHEGVHHVGNGKAYEMLSCLNGALELYRTTGERRLLDVCLSAWADIVENQLYLTGAASSQEVFPENHQLPSMNNVGETCVTVTWLQLNAQLLRLTGEARFAEQLERVVLNQLLGAQKPDCSGWGYYVQMAGKKPYSSTLDGHCCLSSGPRGVALIPTFAMSADADGVVVNLYDAGTAKLALPDGTAVALAIDTRFPTDSRVSIKVDPAAAHTFAVKLRPPAWCHGATVRINGDAAAPLAAGPDGYAALRREWRAGDTIELQLPLAARVVVGDHLNEGRAALLYGPLVLAADDAVLADAGQRVTMIALPSTDAVVLGIEPEPAPDAVKTWPGAQAFRVKVVAGRNSAALKAGTTFETRFLPFADAGGTGSRYRVWLPLASAAKTEVSLLSDGIGSCSESWSDPELLNNEDLNDQTNISNWPAVKEVWFAVTLDASVAIRRVLFRNGWPSENGGWFDASAGKPRVQIQRAKGGEWETIGELADYPATTSSDRAEIPGQRDFTLRLAEPVSAAAVRVIGKPASGVNPNGSLVSCAELQAFAD